MAASVLKGSDEAYEFVCEPCERDNQYEDGVAYCVDCSEYLCSTCLACHKKSRVSRDHNLLDKTSIQQHGVPQNPPSLPPKPKKPTTLPKTSKPTKLARQHDPFTKKCKHHNDEFNKLYCNNHNDLICQVCLLKNHKKCKDVTYIPDVSGDIKRSPEFKFIFFEMKRMQALLGFEHNRNFYNETIIEEIHKSALGDLGKFKEEMLQVIEQVCSDVEQDLNALRDEQLACLASWLESYNGVKAEVENLVQNMEVNINKDNYNQLFVDMKLAKAEMDTLKEKTQKLSDENHVTRYKFEGNADMIEKLKATNGLGKILKKANQSNVSAEFLHELTVKSDDDTEECIIEEVLVLPGGDLALSDNKNKSVKIIDTNKKTVKAQIVLESKPSGIALAWDNQLVVSFPSIDKFQFLRWSKDGLTMLRTVSCSGAGSGIDYHDNQFISVCDYVDGPGKMYVMDIDGNILKKIDKDCLEKPLFSEPHRLTLSSDKGGVYVTEQKNNLKLVNLNGERIAEYQLPGRNTPLGVATDKDGAVYISHDGTHAIFRLSPTCTRPQKLLSEDDGLPRKPYTVALDKHRDLLYIGFMDAKFRNKINVYQLKYDWE